MFKKKQKKKLFGLFAAPMVTAAWGGFCYPADIQLYYECEPSYDLNCGYNHDWH